MYIRQRWQVAKSDFLISMLVVANSNHYGIVNQHRKRVCIVLDGNGEWGGGEEER
jgi:hypothetical protein